MCIVMGRERKPTIIVGEPGHESRKRVEIEKMIARLCKQT